MATSEHIHHDAAGADAPADRRSDPPIYRVKLWPHRSLSNRGFLAVMTVAGAALALPLLPVLGTPVAFGLAPFLFAAFTALWWFLKRNYYDGRLVEELRLWPDLIAVERREPKGAILRWQANPYWVDLKLDPDGRPENYLTLKGGGRVIELGAFLSPEERLALAEDLDLALRQCRAAPA